MSKCTFRVTTFFVAALASLALTPMGSAQQYSFRYYRTEDGLTNQAVEVLAQDRRGFVWAGTESGIFRFDGQWFQRYGPADGLPRDVALSLGEAPDGSLLAGYRVGLYQQKGERFEKVPLPDARGVDSYSGIAFDSAGRTYVATDHGLVEATSAENSEDLALHTIATPAGAGGADAHGIFIESGRVWFGCGTSLCRISGGRVTVFGEAEGLPKGKWMSIRRDGSGDLWVSDQQRFAVLRNGKTRFEPVNPGFPQTAGGCQMEVDGKGRLLIPTVEGLTIYEGHHFRTVGSREGLRGPVYSVLRDREGSIWLGLAGRGLARWRGYDVWEAFTSESGLGSELVYRTLPMGNGTLLVGTEDGLFIGHKKADGWTWQRDTRVPRVPIHTLLREEDGSLWLGTERSGAGRIDAHTRRLEWFRQDRGLEGVQPYSLLIDHSNRIWAATERGLFVAQLSQKRFRHVDEVTSRRCYAVIEEPGGAILVGSLSGVFRLASGHWRRISSQDGLRHDVVLALASARPNEFWVGYWYSGSITRVRVDGERLTMTHFGNEIGLRGDMTYFLGFDARGQLWAGTDQGVRVLTGERWTQYNRNDGLIWDDCDHNGFSAEPDGSVWIGTSGGLAHFTPSLQREPVRSQSVIFTQLTVGKQRVEDGRFVSAGHTGNSLTVRFSALTFAHESSVLYRYRLEPLFEDWRETPQQELQFPGLPPSDYQLEVQSRDSSGQWRGCLRYSPLKSGRPGGGPGGSWPCWGQLPPSSSCFGCAGEISVKSRFAGRWKMPSAPALRSWPGKKPAPSRRK